MRPLEVVQVLLVLVACFAPAAAQMQELPEFTVEPIPLPMECRRGVGCPRPPGVNGVGLLACRTFHGKNPCEGWCQANVNTYLDELRACPPFVEPPATVVDGLKQKCREQCGLAEAKMKTREAEGKPKKPALIYASQDSDGYSYGVAFRGGFKVYEPLRRVKNRCRVFKCDKPEGCVHCPKPQDEFVQACWYCRFTGTVCDSGCIPPDRWQFEL